MIMSGEAAPKPKVTRLTSNPDARQPFPWVISKSTLWRARPVRTPLPAEFPLSKTTKAYQTSSAKRKYVFGGSDFSLDSSRFPRPSGGESSIPEMAARLLFNRWLPINTMLKGTPLERSGRNRRAHIDRRKDEQDMVEHLSQGVRVTTSDAHGDRLSTSSSDTPTSDGHAIEAEPQRYSRVSKRARRS
jgi:hypothetical protein